MMEEIDSLKKELHRQLSIPKELMYGDVEEKTAMEYLRLQNDFSDKIRLFLDSKKSDDKVEDVKVL